MRFHTLLALFAVVAAAACATCAIFSATSASQLRMLERRQAVNEAKLFFGTLGSTLATLQTEIINVAWWEFPQKIHIMLK
eukprot:m51a1_g1676 hypothetical protein (80) ;mRNA; r:416410-420504